MVSLRRANFQLGTDSQTYRKEEVNWKRPTLGETRHSSQVVLPNGNASKGSKYFGTNLMLGYERLRAPKEQAYTSVNQEVAAKMNQQSPDYLIKVHEDNLKQAEQRTALRTSNFSMGNTQLQYKTMADQLAPHVITSDDIVNKHRQMAQKREAMRRANFKMPYVQDMRTEKTTYNVNIS
jgi:hypothetical protein